MKSIFKLIAINQLTISMYCFLTSFYLMVKNKNKKLSIGHSTKLVDVRFGLYNTFYSNVVIKKSNIGNYVYVADGTTIKNTTIGNFCSIGQDVKIGLGIHPTNLISTHPAFFSNKKQCQITFSNKNQFKEIGHCSIGNDVWIGNNVIVKDNVKIGTGAIIGVGSVVTKNVEPYSIVAGIPAKIIRKRFDKNTIDELLKSNWWNKDSEWLQNNVDFFNDPEKWLKMIKNES